MALDISFFLHAAHKKLTGYNSYFKEASLFFAPFTEEYGFEIDFGDTYFGNLRSKLRNVDGRIGKLIENKEVVKYFEKYFENKVIPVLNIHSGMNFISEILKEIKKTDSEMNEPKRDSLINLYEQQQYGKFLAQSFLYALSIPNRKRTSLSKPHDDQAIDPVYQSLLSKMEQLESGLNVNPSPSDFKIAVSDKYDISYTAKDPKDAFLMQIFIDKKSLPTECEDIGSLFRFLIFSGKPQELRIVGIHIKTADGELIKRIDNSLFVGEKVAFPVIKTLKYDTSEVPSCPGIMVIKAKNELKGLEMRDEQGNILLSMRRYRVEREKSNKRILASFISDEDKYLTIKINFDVQEKPMDIMSGSTSMSIIRKDNTSVICNLQYFELLQKMTLSGHLLFYRDNNGNSSPFISAQFTESTDPVMPDVQKMILILQRLYHIEQHFKVTFDISDFTEGNLYYAQILYQMITDGRATIHSQTMQVNYSPDEVDELDDLIKNGSAIMLDSNLESITVFDQVIRFYDEYMIRWYSDEINQNEDGSVTVLARSSTIYRAGVTLDDSNEVMGHEK